MAACKYQSDWEASSSEEEEKSQPAAPVAPPKKKGTLKAKLAEKEALKAQKAASDDIDYDEDAVLDPREKARRDKERELAADLNNAADLFGAAALGGTFLLLDTCCQVLLSAMCYRLPLSLDPIRASPVAALSNHHPHTC